MNKKILTRVISFVLVICLLVPVIPNLGLDLGSVTASAAMPTPSSTVVLFKTGAKYYWNGSEVSMNTAPVYSAGSYYLPSSAVNTITGSSFTDDYVEVTHGGTVYGSWKTYISNMGVIQLTTGSDTISSASDDEQIAWIKENVFDHGSNSGAFTAVKSTDHPYLLANQTYFDSLNAVYNDSESDTVLYGYLNRLVNEAESLYNKYSTKDTTDGALQTKYAADGDEDLSVIISVTRDGTKYDAYGYDVGGRQGYSVTISSYIEKLAFAYQVTREDKYAKLALNMSLALAAWPHWGAGHFLNAADTSYHMALAFDWCYDVWGTISSANLKTVKEALFTKGVMAGIYDSLGSESASYTHYTSFGSSTTETRYYRVNAWYNNVLGGGSDIYNTRTNNWNGVCSSGMIMAALALMIEGTTDVSELTITAINSSGTQTEDVTLFDTSYFKVTYRNSKWATGTTATYTISDAAEANGTSVSALSTYQGACAWLINNNLYNLEQYGLAQYVPDGSYVESASYWAYGTNSIFRTIASLESACGTDFGLSGAWGFDKTAYFANYAQDSNGLSWRYHDDSSSSVDTSMNAIYGAIIGDDNLVGYRKYLIEKGAAGATIYDALYYDKDVTDFTKMSLDYYMEGIEGYTMRSSWENDAAYVAFMGGPNYVNHGQVDSGAFVYHNNGTAWFQDIGTENYNAYEFGYGTTTTANKKEWSSTSDGYMYYPQVAEGNNTLATSTGFGQKWGETAGADAAIDEYGSNEYGGYALLNQTSVYDATSATRGILMTNNRKTVVIQDEVTFSSSTTAYWIGHVYDSISITLSDDGKTAYLTDGRSTIRCTLVQPSDAATSYTFTVEDATVHYSEGTAENDYSKEGNGISSNDYSAWQKLVVACTGTSVQLAIVIEEVALGDDFGCGYEWTSMSGWSEAILTPDENNYDDKILLSKDFDIEGVGTFSSKNGNLRIVNTLVDGDNAMGAYINTGSTVDSNITLAAAAGKVVSASIGNGMLVTEFDVKTLTTLPEGLSFALYGTDIYPIVEFDASLLGTPSGWTHVTMVLDEQTDMYYLYVGETCVIKESFVTSSYENLKLVISTDSGAITEGNLLIDDVLIRTYTETYTALDTILDNSTVGSDSDIFDWSDGIGTKPHEGAIGKIYVEEIDADAPDVDTPVVDFWDVTSSETEAGAEVVDTEGKEVDSFAELETLINTGSYTNVTLYTGNDTAITISERIEVDTNGYSFYAVSDNLICQVDGDIHTYKAGTVRVAYVINGATTYVNVYNTQPASYTVPASAIGLLKSVDNGDGTTSYIVTEQDTWSKTAYGAVLYGNELIVTSENNRFYLTGNAYSGYFITVSGSTVTGYDDPYALFTVMKSSTNYDKIIITNDFLINESSGAYSVTGTKNLYVNGHTITYDVSGESHHLFQLQEDDVLNVYGPGTFDMDAPLSNFIMKAAYAETPSTVNDVTIIGVRTLIDHRMGTIVFNNCDVVLEKNGIMFSVNNRSAGVDNNIVDEDKMALLVLNGGTYTNNYATGTNSLVNVKDNARLSVKGGAVLTSPGTYAAIHFEHANAIADGVTSTAGDGTGVGSVYLHLGEYYLSGNDVLWSYRNHTAETSADMRSKIYLAAGIGSASATIDHAITGVNVNNTTGSIAETVSSTITQLAPDHGIAMTGSAGYAYVVAKTEDIATVIWQNSDNSSVIVTESWLAGTTPVMGSSVKDYLAGLTASDGMKYTCDLSALGGTGVVGGQTHTLLSKQVTDLQLRIGMDLYSELHVSIYVQKKDGVTYNSIKINGVEQEYDEVGLGAVNGVSGRFYRILLKIDPKDAGELITVSVNINDGEEITAVTSVLNYANKVLSGIQGGATKNLMYAVVQYIGASAAYSGDRYTNGSCDALLAQYSEYAPDVQLSTQKPEANAVKDAVKSVYLDLGTAPSFAFRFQSDYTGTVTISYTNVDGEVVETAIEVTEGIASDTESSVYVLIMRAYDMASDITIAADGNTYAYNLDTYYTQAVSAQDELYDLVYALKSYCQSAKAYKA